MNAKTNGAQPAHPVHELLQDRDGDYTMCAEGGLTKREAFAMAAMQGYICAGSTGMPTPQRIAQFAIEAADEMLAVLSQEPQQ